jgi:hypothetical protein
MAVWVNACECDFQIWTISKGDEMRSFVGDKFEKKEGLPVILTYTPYSSIQDPNGNYWDNQTEELPYWSIDDETRQY